MRARADAPLANHSEQPVAHRLASVRRVIELLESRVKGFDAEPRAAFDFPEEIDARTVPRIQDHLAPYPGLGIRLAGPQVHVGGNEIDVTVVEPCDQLGARRSCSDLLR